MLAVVSVILSVCVFKVSAQTLTCPNNFATLADADFRIIGASGGDTKTACENTAAATTAGLVAGMNAVELDVSVSKDNVVFLWNDPNPLDPAATARSKGVFVAGMCRPSYSTIFSARELTFNIIRENYKYVNSSGNKQDVTIPTLTEWMTAFAANTALKTILIDLKITEVSMADFLVLHIMSQATVLGAASKMRILSSSREMVGALQSAMARAGYNLYQVSRQHGGTIAGVHFGYDSTVNFDPVTEAQAECYDIVSLGQTASSNGWREYQNIVVRQVSKQSAVTGSYTGLYTWKINQVEKMSWLMCAGVNGIVTDSIETLASLQNRRTAGSIVCCTEEKTPWGCLTPLDPRIAGQGCSNLGLSWHDKTVDSCMFTPIDIFSTGTKLTCQQNKFCGTSG